MLDGFLAVKRKCFISSFRRIHWQWWR